MRCMAIAALLGAALAAPDADLVNKVPGFNATNFKVYSGYLAVPGPFKKTDNHDALSIHYQLHMSQSNPSKDPLVTWHQGGPGGSSINVGLYTEMGYFQLSDQGSYVNENAWNKVANMLYLESPAGSGSSSGFSTCLKGGKVVDCEWDDVSQAEAYAHTLAAFQKAFPELASNDLYLTGESYFGQYGPNIASFILNNSPFDKQLNLKGIALGNACWGGDENSVVCNGPNSDQNDVDMFFGKGLVSKELYESTYETCQFNFTDDFEPSRKCEEAVEAVHEAVGPHNVYNIYDNCPRQREWLERHGKSTRWLLQQLRKEMSSAQVDKFGAELVDEDLALLRSSATPTGGYTWSCGGEGAAEDFFQREDVQKAMHLNAPGQSRFSYSRSGPASITLYPSLVGKLRILIYNGDADSCVPYKGNEQWIDSLKNAGMLAEKEAWRPWFADNNAGMPAGYTTSYTVPKSDLDFSFVTIRLAGHMVPTFQPAVSLSFITRFLQEKPF